MTRRRVVTGIAWAAPAAVVTTPVLAVQASMCMDGGSAPDIGFGTVATTGTARTWTTSTWIAAQDGGNDDSAWLADGNAHKLPGFRQTVEFAPNDTSLAPWFGVGTEPRREVTVRAWKEEGVLLNPQCSYTLSANYATWEGDPFTPQVTVALVHADGETRITAFELETRTGGIKDWERRNDPVESEAFSVPSVGPWTPEIRIYFPNALTESANDIYLRNIALNPVVN